MIPYLLSVLSGAVFALPAAWFVWVRPRERELARVRAAERRAFADARRTAEALADVSARKLYACPWRPAAHGAPTVRPS